MENDIDEGFWIRPQDHTPNELEPVDTERNERTPDGKYVTGRLLHEILLFWSGSWYTVGLKRKVGPLDAVQRWRKIIESEQEHDYVNSVHYVDRCKKCSADFKRIPNG